MQSNFSNTNIQLKDKFLSLDFFMIFLVLILGVISIFAMYSTEQGNYGYYTKRVYQWYKIFGGYRKHRNRKS